MKLLLLIACAVVCVVLGFAWKQPWIGGAGLLVAFIAMFTDGDEVSVADEKDACETSTSVRNMRDRDR
ncbi:hypothetical protein AGRA3207_007002 [Actinomadura graeca]|uniref:Uncharacterized protein n=1 Tax=Actinomadura graeca TaxID=2750812 RepID=A0ABX8R360_9ACTN|nr:hypothetical protein [Actinomadura graeca]QXJ25500.1 hypothetical protein AGRA3207_007002 [Actinomadura graeca]